MDCFDLEMPLTGPMARRLDDRGSFSVQQRNSEKSVWRSYGVLDDHLMLWYMLAVYTELVEDGCRLS